MAGPVQRYFNALGSWKVYFACRKERCSRLQWWFVRISAPVIWMLSFIIHYIILALNHNTINFQYLIEADISEWQLWMSIILDIVIFYVYIVVDVKRSFDLNSIKYFYLFYSVSIFLIVASLFVEEGQIAVLATIGIACILWFIAYIAVFGFVSGTKGDNRYGPDPRRQNRPDPPEGGQSAEAGSKPLQGEQSVKLDGSGLVSRLP